MQLPDLDNLLLRLAATTRQKRAEEMPASNADVRRILEDEDSSAVGCFLAVQGAPFVLDSRHSYGRGTAGLGISSIGDRRPLCA